MGIALAKGGRIQLAKEDPTMTKVRVGLGWNPNEYSSGFDYDLDVSAFVLKQDAQGKGKMLSEDYMIFYNQPISPEGAVKHSGDDKTGGGSEGDDETIIVDLSLLPAAADEISFVVTIHEAVERKQNFGQVTKSYIKLYNDETGKVVAQYELEDGFSSETAVQFGSLYKKDGHWSFRAVGQGFNVGLADFVLGYGGQLA
jgi:tellurium resistance protein TerD